MSICKAIIQEGVRKGLQCTNDVIDDAYCGRHQRNKKYDEGIASGIRWCRFFFRGCDNQINELPENLTSCQACRDKKRKRPNCGHEGCDAQAQEGETFCGKHLRDKYRIEEIEKGIRYCDIARGCFNICEEKLAKCSSCLEKHRTKDQERLDARREQNTALSRLGCTNMRICIKCNKEFEVFTTKGTTESHKCPSCFETQQRAESNRPLRERNYKEERFINLQIQYNMYISNAFRNNKEFPLQFDKFCELVSKPCFYCDHHIEGEVNGIDRINNDLDYEPNNCVPCCEICNRMKLHYHPSFFILKAKIMCGQVIADEEFFKKWSMYYTNIHQKTYPKYLQYCNRRGFPLKLTQEEYVSLIRKPCYLCGYSNKKGIGIDRFDSSIKEYSLPNCRPCCTSCNTAKLDYEYTIFIRHCAILAAKWKDTSSLDHYPIPINLPNKGITAGVLKYVREEGSAAKETVEESEEESKPRQWRAKTIYRAILSNSIDDYYNQNKDDVTKEDIDVLNNTVKGINETDGLAAIKTFLNTINKRRARKALKN